MAADAQQGQPKRQQDAHAYQDRHSQLQDAHAQPDKPWSTRAPAANKQHQESVLLKEKMT